MYVSLPAPPDRLQRAWLSVAVLAGLLIASGCGTEGESQKPSPRISTGDYRQLDRLYEIGVEAERLQSRPRAAMRLMAEACDSVDRSRPLLRAAVAGCEEFAALADSAGVPECEGNVDRCVSALRDVSTLIDEAVGLADASGETFVELLGDTPCADALAPPPAYLDAFRSLGSAYDDLAVAVETGDEHLADAAGADLERTAGQLEDGPSAVVSLKRFRADCPREGRAP